VTVVRPCRVRGCRAGSEGCSGGFDADTGFGGKRRGSGDGRKDESDDSETHGGEAIDLLFSIVEWCDGNAVQSQV
jgi:hypothetical protein